MSRPRILLVDDDRTFRLSTSELLRQDGYEVQSVASGAEAVDALKASRFDIMLLDLRMPGIDGTGLVTALREWGDGIPVLMISGFGTVDAAVHALHAGADDFLTKPVEPAVLSDRVARLLERRPATDLEQNSMPGGLVGRSPAMKMVFEAIRLVAPTDATVLILGETGTGKELVARSLHELSARADGPFIAVNCAALPESLLESELFGHLRGSFTGAHRDKTGLFEAANGGTIFLDEIGDVSAAMQHRLLRVLQERELMPVGAVKSVAVNVRVIAATNRDLRADVAAGRFRDDLFYRLNVFRIELPALRTRRSDVPLLVEHALERLAPRAASRPTCSPFAMRMLQTYDWPGNVRELFAVLESAWIRSGSARIEAQHLPAEVRESIGTAAASRLESRYRADSPAADERDAIIAALEQADGVRSRAAELLGMGRTTLWRKMKQFGLDGNGSGAGNKPG
ncbi:MAG TPA: sigma-54 dependent transcriptional regulator [Longimicrobiales bacterium]|nr:sigma-54 dependent transcriptional regulator [Longimicrobiales bacterium]